LSDADQGELRFNRKGVLVFSPFPVRMDLLSKGKKTPPGENTRKKRWVLQLGDLVRDNGNRKKANTREKLRFEGGGAGVFRTSNKKRTGTHVKWDLRRGARTPSRFGGEDSRRADSPR